MLLSLSMVVLSGRFLLRTKTVFPQDQRAQLMIFADFLYCYPMLSRRQILCFILFFVALRPPFASAELPYLPEPGFVVNSGDFARIESFRTRARDETYIFTVTDSELLSLWVRTLINEGCIRPADLPLDLLWLRASITATATLISADDAAGQVRAREVFAKLDLTTNFWFADGTLGNTDGGWSRLEDWTRATSTPSGLTLLFPNHYPLALDFFAEGIVRVRGKTGGHFQSAGLTPIAAKVTETPTGLLLRVPWGEVELQRAPFRMELRANGRTLWRNSTTEFFHDGSREAVRIRSALPPGEALFGLGEQYASVNQRGRIVNLWVEDAINSTFFMHWKQTYKPVPFYVSPSGYGLFYNSTNRGRYDLGATDAAVSTITFAGAVHDFFLIAEQDPLRIIERYSLITGRPVLPPDWALQPWAGGGTKRWQVGTDEATWFQEVRTTVERYATLRIPHAAIFIEGIPTHAKAGAELIAWLRERGLRTLVWFGPATDANPTARDGFTAEEQRSFLVHNPDGTPFIIPKDRFLGGGAYIDFTQPEINRFMRQRFAWAMEAGIAGAMLDGGEEIAPVSRFADGSTGETTHNRYPYLYHRAYSDLFRSYVGDDFILFGRAGAAGDQQIAQFSGDLPVTFGGLAAAVRGLQTAAASGLVFWGSDIGGYMHRDDLPLTAPLLVRWAQFAAFSPLMRQHGETPREPWLFGDEAVEGYRQAAWLRMNLQPFLLAVSLRAHEQGRPLVASLALAFPGDRTAVKIEDEYLLGDTLLVAPVLNAEGLRTVYFPMGQRWYSLFAPGEVNLGGTQADLALPLLQPAVYLREGCMLPLQLPANMQFGVPWSKSETFFLLAPGTRPSAISFSLKNGSGLSYRPRKDDWEVRGWGAGGTRTFCLLDVGPMQVERLGKPLPTLSSAGFAAGREGVWYEPEKRRLCVRLTSELDQPVLGRKL